MAPIDESLAPSAGGQFALRHREALQVHGGPAKVNEAKAKGGSKGVVHKNAVSRKISRLAHAVAKASRKP